MAKALLKELEEKDLRIKQLNETINKFKQQAALFGWAEEAKRDG